MPSEHRIWCKIYERSMGTTAASGAEDRIHTRGMTKRTEDGKVPCRLVLVQ